MFNLIPWGKSEQGTAVNQRTSDPFSVMRNEFDSLFDRFFERWSAPMLAEDWRGGWGFETDETDREYVIRAEAPGFDSKDFDVQVSGNMVTVKAEQGQEGKNGRSHRKLFRSFSVPVGADAQQVAANYKNGVLELHIPKRPEVQGRRIEVKG